jgi:hypothetical protein
MNTATATINRLTLDRRFLIAELNRLAASPIEPTNPDEAEPTSSTARIVTLVPRPQAVQMVPGKIFSPRHALAAD